MSKPIDKLLLPFNPYTLDSNGNDAETQKDEINAELAATHLKLQHDLLMLFDGMSGKLNKPTNADLCPGPTPNSSLDLTRERVEAIQAKPASRESATIAFVTNMKAQLIPTAVDCSVDPITGAVRKAEPLLVQLLCMPKLRPKL